MTDGYCYGGSRKDDKAIGGYGTSENAPDKVTSKTPESEGQISLVALPTLVPVGVERWPCDVSYRLDDVLPKSDAVMMLRVQRERMNAAYFPTEREYSRRYGLDGERMAKMPEHAIVMHPGPMVRGMEITAEVADSDRCTAVEQVANGVSTRMAVLYLLLGGSETALPSASARTEENK
jgi:aspartate carbamoyltransferase catalytic subunit